MAILQLLLTGFLVGIAFAQFPAYEDVTDFNLPNNSLYLRWRPRYHVLAPAGHMNDPCGPMYDPTTKLYHIFYQSFPQHVGFGNTSWSHATSPDLVSWTDVRGWQNRSMVAVATGPYPQYDWIGAFSGGAQPVNLRGEADGNLTLAYSGASHFPDNWKVPYAFMTEQQALATSSDGGKTWQKYGVVIDRPPGGWNVTGLRDPIFAKMPEMDRVLGREESWYLVMGSGIRGVGPRIPLFAAPSNDLTNWTFLGGLFEIDRNISWGGDTRTGNFGYNFELAGLFTLPEPDGERWVLTMGAEGIITTANHPVAHWSLFAMGEMTRRDNGSADLEITASGVTDWGESYALNQFYDPVNERRIIWGWTDEDLNSTLPALRAQGFAGSLGLPRELYIMTTYGVAAPAEGIGKGAEMWIADGNGTYTVKALAQRPLFDVVSAIQGQGQNLGMMTISNTTMLNVNSSAFHIQVSGQVNESFSVIFCATEDMKEYTLVTYLPGNSSIVLDRTHSTLLTIPQTPTYIGYLPPYTYSNGTSNPLSLDIFVDGSLIEIFANDRFAMTSRIYPSRHDALGVGITVSSGSIDVEVSVWDEMLNVWPNRPLNASSPLVFDPYYETHLTFPSDLILPPGSAIYDGWKRDMRNEWLDE